MSVEVLAVDPVLTARRMAFRTGMQRFMRGLLSAVSDYHVEGLDQMPQKGPLLVVLNHLGLLDAPLMLAGLPQPPDVIMLDQMLDIPVLGRFLRWYGIIPVTRDGYDRAALRRGVAVLRSGRILAIAPEAGVSESGRLEDAQAGAAYLAMLANVPVLPAALVGTETIQGLWDEVTQKLSFRGLHNLIPWSSEREKPQLKLTFGHPFSLETAGQSWREKREALRSATDEIMGRIAALLPVQYRGVYDGAMERLGILTRDE